MMEACRVINALGIGVRALFPELNSLPGCDLSAFDFCDQAGVRIVGFGEHGLLYPSIAGLAFAGHRARLTGYIIG